MTMRGSLLAVTMALGLTCGACGGEGLVATSEADTRVAAILDLRLAGRQDPEESPASKELAIALESLLRDKGPTADQAICSLLTYYLGEANDEDVFCSAVSRGPGMLACLRNLLTNGPQRIGAKYASLERVEETWRYSVREAIKAIENGVNPCAD